MPLGAFRQSLNLANFLEAGPTLGEFDFFKVLNNPNPFSTTLNDRFSNSVAISENYVIVGASDEDDAGGTSSGKAYIYSTATGNLIYTLNNPNPFGTSSSDIFGVSVGISDNYAIVGASFEDDSNFNSGKAYIYSTSNGSLLYTLNNSNAFGTTDNDRFGQSVAITNSYAIVGAPQEDDSGTNAAGKAYIYSTATGALLYTLNNPNAFSTSDFDNFGISVAISENYAIVGANNEDDAAGSDSGKAYIYSTATGALLYTLNNPNAYSTSATDRFGTKVAISNSYAIVGAEEEDDDGGTGSGKAYIFSTSTGALLHTLNNPNPFSTTVNDFFGASVGISENYAIVGAPYEEESSTNVNSGNVYIYSTSSGELLQTINNPTAFGTSSNDRFGISVAISENYAIVGANEEDDPGGTGSGKAYLLTTDPSEYISIVPSGLILSNQLTAQTTNFTMPTGVQQGDIAMLFDLSLAVTDVTPSGWTSIVKSTTTNIRSNVSYRKLNGTEGGTTVTGMAGTTRKVVLIYRDVGNSNPTLSFSTPAQQATTLKPTDQTITVGSGKTIYFAVYGKSTSTTPTRGFTQTGNTFNEFQTISTSGIYVRTSIAGAGTNSPANASATITMTDAGTNTLQSFRMSIT
jgi:hypothetical protein